MRSWQPPASDARLAQWLPVAARLAACCCVTQELFKIAGEEGEGRSPWSFTVSMMEIYNETVRDLLASAAAPAGSGGSGGGSGGSPSSSSNGGFGGSGSPPAGSAHGVLSSSLDVTGLPAGELPPHIDRCGALVYALLTAYLLP